MSEYKSKIKRQLEIIGIALSNKEHLTTFDLAEKFQVEELTIKRDLRDIRAEGIDIHSSKKNGVTILSPIHENKLKEFILEYISFSYSETYHDKATTLLVKKHFDKGLTLIIDIQKAIETRKNILIDYHSKANFLKKDVEISPIRIFQAGNDWRLLAINDGIIKQYLISKIENINPSKKTFSALPDEQIDQMFRLSLKSWLGKDQYDVKIKFTPVWAAVIKEREFIETQKITDCADGSIIFEATVNSLAEVATWILSFGKGAKVLSPVKLRNEIIRLSKEALSQY